MAGKSITVGLKRPLMGVVHEVTVCAAPDGDGNVQLAAAALTYGHTVIISAPAARHIAQILTDAADSCEIL